MELFLCGQCRLGVGFVSVWDQEIWSLIIVVWGSARACGWSWSRVRSRVVGAGYTQASSGPKIGGVSDFQHPSGCEWPAWSRSSWGRAARRESARWVTGMDGRHPFWRSPPAARSKDITCWRSAEGSVDACETTLCSVIGWYSPLAVKGKLSA